MVFYVNEKNKNKVMKAMKDLLYIPFEFDNNGTSVVYYNSEAFEPKDRD